MVLTLKQVWARLSTQEKVQAAKDVMTDASYRNERALIDPLLANAKNTRLTTMKKFPEAKRAEMLASLPQLPLPLQHSLLIVYHLKQKPQLLADFLDTLQIPNTAGLITADEFEVKPDLLPAAVEAVRAKHPANDVENYFSTLVGVDPATWGALAQFEPLATGA